MAKGSAIIGKIKGHAGNLVFRVRKGEQIIQTKPGPRGKDHLPTYNQAWNYMRFKWASFMSQVTLELTDHSFTRKYRNQSSTNKFIQANVQNFNPINKKCQNIFDLSVEAPLTFNGIQMSSGDMAPLNLTLGQDTRDDDLNLLDSGEYDGVTFSLRAFNGAGDVDGQAYTWEELLETSSKMAVAKKWAISKGLKPGEMLTIVIMTARGLDTYGSWSLDRDLAYGLEMAFIRFKLDTDGTTFIVEPSESIKSLTDKMNYILSTQSIAIGFAERYIVGACLIHSKEVYGGWECDDTIMQMINPATRNWMDNYTWEQSATTLYQNSWSTQDLPILDPASLTEEDQDMLRTGRVITTVNARGQKVYVSRQTEEVTIEGENLEVGETKKKSRKSTQSPEE